MDFNNLFYKLSRRKRNALLARNMLEEIALEMSQIYEGSLQVMRFNRYYQRDGLLFYVEERNKGKIKGLKQWNERRKIMIVGRNANGMYVKAGYPSDVSVVKRYSDKYRAQGLEIGII